MIVLNQQRSQMKKELITEESVEALLKDVDEDDRRTLSIYTHMMLKAFANKDNYKIAIIFDNDETLGVGAINMTTAEVINAFEAARQNLYEVITTDMPPKEMLN